MIRIIRSGSTNIKACFGVDSFPAGHMKHGAAFELLEGPTKTGCVFEIHPLIGFRSTASLVAISP
jgi:hypothetical protein